MYNILKYIVQNTYIHLYKISVLYKTLKDIKKKNTNTIILFYTAKRITFGICILTRPEELDMLK